MRASNKGESSGLESGGLVSNRQESNSAESKGGNYRPSKILDAFVRIAPEFITILLVIYAFLPVLSPILFSLDAYFSARLIQNVYQKFCHQRVERSLFLFGEETVAGKSAIGRFYTIEELKNAGAIPEVNPNAPFFSVRETYYGYPYWGNDEVGYKVAFCVRDMALYSAMAATCIVMLLWIRAREAAVGLSKNRNQAVGLAENRNQAVSLSENRNQAVSLAKNGGQNDRELRKAGVDRKRRERMAVIPRVPVWIYAVLILPMTIDGLFQTYVEIFGVDFISQGYVDNIPKRIVTGALFGIGFGLFAIINLKRALDLD